MGALLLIGAGLSWLHRNGVSICLFHRLTGLPCLTCGTTRAAAALVAGDPAGALRQQPLAVIGGLAACMCFSIYSFFLLVRRRVVRVGLTAKEGLLFGAVLLALAVLNWLYLVRCGA